MNIWIFNHYAVTPDMPGGTRHYDFGQELVKRGHNVTIFASSFNHQKLIELKLNNRENYKIDDYEGVRFIWIKTFPYKLNNWRRFVNMISYMYRVFIIGKFLNIHKDIKKPDIIIGSSVHLFAVLVAYYMSKTYKARFIMEVRDLWPQTLVDLGNISRFHPAVLIFRVMEKFLYKRSKKIITLLPNADIYLCSLGIDKDKIVYIPNGANLMNFNLLDKNDKINDKYFKILYVGGHSQTDNLYTFLEAAQKIKDMKLPIKFILVGDGMEKQNLMRYAEKKELNNVIFKLPIVKSEVPKILTEADALYLSMQNSIIYKYGISFNKLFEYMAAGKPIILYGNPENNPIERNNAGVVVKSVEEVTNAIINIFHMSPDDRYKMGRRGRIYVERYHNIPVLVDRLENVINEA